jgi:L-aminopeptidase/D-esterase-like protein
VVGGGEHSSGDMTLACSVANRDPLDSYRLERTRGRRGRRGRRDAAGHRDHAAVLAAIEAVEEVIPNALVAAETMTGPTASRRPPSLTTGSSR